MAIRHGTLTANTAATVSLADRDTREVWVMHKGNVVDPLYARCDGTAATVGGNDCYAVLPGQHRMIPRIWSAGRPTTVSLIAATGVAYEVEFP